MTNFAVPTDWKSAKWWQNRSPEERYFHTKTPKRFANIDGFSLPVEAKNWLHSYEPGANLFITGKSGVGKTITAALLLKRLVTERPLSGRFIPSDIYIEMLKDQFDNDNLLPEMYSSPYLIRYIQGVYDVIVLDGVGQERETEFASHEIGSLIRRRHNDMRTLIITSSLSVTDFTRRYGERVKSAVTDMTVLRMT